MPNRIIKESIRTSKSINNLSDFQFRVWLYLITYVDDYGRGSADPELLKGLVFPRRKGITELQIAKALSELANTGIINLYEVDGESYLCFPTWEKHQRIQTKKSKYPAPQESTVIHRESPPESNPNPNTNITPLVSKETFPPTGGASATKRPTLEEVEAYCKERNNRVNPQAFIDYYSSNGWKVGKNPMKDWKACVRTWEQRERKPVGADRIHQRKYTAAELDNIGIDLLDGE